MADSFFVDSDGLNGGANAFASKAAELQALAQHVHDLANPGRVAAAAGNDDNGKEFANTHVEAAGKVFAGLDAWAKAVGGTTDAVRSMAEVFRDVDGAATDVTVQLRDAITDLATGGGGGGAATPEHASNPTPSKHA
ncbi:hypothetical protein ACWEOE_00210 [Amycolatopsis sp. NPDC004368]